MHDGNLKNLYIYDQVKDLNHTKGTYETFHGLPLKPAKNDIMPS